MPWSGGVFSRTNGTHTGSTVWAQDSAAGTGITTTPHDTHDQDLATGINFCLTKDGSNVPTANLAMGGFKHTGAAAASGTGQYMRYDEVTAGYQPLDATLTALAGVATAADKVIYATGSDTFTATDFKSFGRTLAGCAAQSDALTAIGTGTISQVGVLQLATSAEAITGTDTAKAITSADLAAAALPGHDFASYAATTQLTAVIPLDDTIPQNTEGTQILSVSITPKKTTNRVRVRFMGNVNGITSITEYCIVALFQDSVANALAATATFLGDDNGSAGFPSKMRTISLEFEHSPATTSAVTYKLRAGPTSNSFGSGIAFNISDNSGTRVFGGVSAATLVAEEILT